jgi:hypothetical protein
MSFLPRGHSMRRPAGVRAGIVIGVALAFVGLAVGTATGATTPFQQVVVVNAPASPIPVVGTVNVGNTPANQNVTVSNFPATQPVSGTVSVSPVHATKTYETGHHSIDAISDITVTFPAAINVSTLVLNNEGHSDSMSLSLHTVAGPINLYAGDGSFLENFTVPVPATGVLIFCDNSIESCDFSFGVLGS